MSHEAELLAVLEKVGQQSVPATEMPAPLPVPVEGWRPSPVTRKTLFVHHDTHPVVYDVALLKEYGVDWFVWEPQTLWCEILRDFKVPSISDHAKSKIQAIKTLHITASYWTEWEVFSWITQALNNNIPDWHTMQKPSIGQLMNSVDVATMVRSGESFSDEVSGYVAGCILEEDVVFAPDDLRFAQQYIDQYAAEKKIEDYPALVMDTQIKYYAVRNGADVEFHETAADIQVAKLKVAWDYLTKRRAQLKEQLLLLT